MENLKEYEVGSKDKKYDISKWRYSLIKLFNLGVKLVYLGVAIFITVLLHNECLFNPDCNPIVITYFAILGLGCFIQAGFPIDKLVGNIKLP